MVTLLTSSNLEYLRECLQCILQQRPVDTLVYDVFIVVNTLNNDFKESVDALIATMDYSRQTVRVVQTASNGRPGKGHNSVLELFRMHPEYDYLYAMDGDDFAYPCLLQQLSKYIYTQTPPDVLALMFHDILTSGQLNDGPAPSYPE